MSLLHVEGIEAFYGRGRSRIQVLDGVGIELNAGEVVGVVGESGSGKSTLAKAILGLVPVDRGEVRFDGAVVDARNGFRTPDFRRRVQMVFQNPYGSLDPRMLVWQTLAEALELRTDITRRDWPREIGRLLELVELPARSADSYPHQFSGGQRQRIAIARALAVRPDLIIADEITSALDLTTQATILELVRNLVREQSVALLLISHNLGVIRSLCTRVSVMHLGRIVESASVEDLFDRPAHPYTAGLINAVPSLSRKRR